MKVYVKHILTTQFKSYHSHLCRDDRERPLLPSDDLVHLPVQLVEHVLHVGLALEDLLKLLVLLREPVVPLVALGLDLE